MGGHHGGLGAVRVLIGLGEFIGIIALVRRPDGRVARAASADHEVCARLVGFNEQSGFGEADVVRTERFYEELVGAVIHEATIDSDHVSPRTCSSP